MNNRGAIQDVFFGIAFLFAFAVVGLIALNITDEVTSGLNSTAQFSNYGSTTQDAINNIDDIGGMADTVFMIIFVGYILALIASTLAVDFNPAFFWIFALLSILGVVVAVPFSNAYGEFLTTSFASYSVDLTITQQVMANLPFVIAIISTVLLVAQYAKSKI